MSLKLKINHFWVVGRVHIAQLMVVYNDIIKFKKTLLKNCLLKPETNNYFFFGLIELGAVRTDLQMLTGCSGLSLELFPYQGKCTLGSVRQLVEPPGVPQDLFKENPG